MAATIDKVSIDDAQTSGFQIKVTILSSGAEFIDGYILGMIGPALISLAPLMHLDAVWNGLIGASALVGIFLGGLIFGYLTDIFGRKLLFTLDLLLFVIASALQYFIRTPMDVLILRLIMGIAIGADYPIAQSLVSEFVTKKQRGPSLAFVIVAWYIGYVCASLIGLVLSNVGTEPWKWMMLSSLIPALAFFIMRFGVPESPRWLASKGRFAEAQEIVHKYLGENVDINQSAEEDKIPTKYSDIFKGEYGKRTAFVSIFYACQVAPFFAIFSFAPQVYRSLHLGSGFASNLGVNIFLLIGGILGILAVNKIGRRKLLIIPFIVTALCLFVLGIWPSAPSVVLVICFATFALFNSASSDLQSIYPLELFPTRLRATGTGFATAMSRVGAATGTFLLPVSIAKFGLGTSMLFGTGILLIGTIFSIMWAPETTNLALTESASLDI